MCKAVTQKSKPRSSFFRILGILMPTLIVFGLMFRAPASQFTFRIWEAIRVRQTKTFPPGPFYCNQHIQLPEVGDLAPYTENAVLKNVVWDTDRYGFRNSPGLCPRPDVVTIGDSMVAGTSLTQGDTLASQLQKQTDRCVWNLGGLDIEKAMAFLEAHGFHPSVVIELRAERFVRHFDSWDQAVYLRELRQQKIFAEYPVAARAADQLTQFWDFVAFNPFQAFKAHFGWTAALLRLFQDREKVSLVQPPGDPESPSATPNAAPKEKPMLFLKDPSKGEEKPSEQALRAAAAIRSQKDFVLKTGAQFLFVPIPEKETIYPELAHGEGDPKPTSFYVDLQNQLSDKGIWTVDLRTPFRQMYDQDHAYAYQTDDTHWNERGVAAAVVEIQKRRLY